MKGIRKIKAGALQFVLFIGAIVAVLLMAFVLLSHTHTLFNKKTELTADLLQAVDQGLYLSFEKDIALGDSIDIPSMDNGEISVSVRRSYWGVFEKYSSKASFKNIAVDKTVLVGRRRDAEIPALYLRDKQRPLIIAGSSKITGDAYLPEQGIRMGNISGNSYHHDRLLYGKQLKSRSELPKIGTELLQQIKFLTSNDFPTDVDVIALKTNLELKNPFSSPTKYIMGSIVRLEQVSLIGNVIVMATQKISVSSTSTLKDVVLIAPEIIIGDKVQGYFQAIASGNISVGKNCRLMYPTALMVHKRFPTKLESNTRPDPNLYVDSGSDIRGMVMYLEDSEKQSYAPQIKIERNASVTGELYCSKNLELKGSVFGNVTTDAFIALENGSIYQNHLYDGKINSEGLSTEYSGLPVEGKQDKSIMKWLY